MSSEELDAFSSAVASVSLETNVLTDDVVDIIKKSIEEGLPVAEMIQQVLAHA